MPSITDLAYTDNFADAKKPILTDLRAALDSIETHINDKVADNLVQLAKDAFGTTYAFDDDAAAQFVTMNLYDKLTAEDVYTAANIAIAAVGAWTDVDAANASIDITPEYLAGDFAATFQFAVKVVTTNAINVARLSFRITDGTDTSDAIPEIWMVTGVNATTFQIPVMIRHQFSAWSVAAKNVKLQYYITTSTATTLSVVVPIAMQVEKI